MLPKDHSPFDNVLEGVWEQQREVFVPSAELDTISFSLFEDYFAQRMGVSVETSAKRIRELNYGEIYRQMARKVDAIDAQRHLAKFGDDQKFIEDLALTISYISS